MATESTAQAHLSGTFFVPDRYPANCSRTSIGIFPDLLRGCTIRRIHKQYFSQTIFWVPQREQAGDEEPGCELNRLEKAF
jgi:hypothetical protein